MTIETWGLIALIVAPAIVWGIKRYLKIMADGKISLNEGLETIIDGMEIIEEVSEDIEKVVK
tara:strand:+ start:342 stop:527 length:186 start_codon:yes stop_codon:yes gene_type:complete